MVCERANELMMRYMDGLLDDFDKMNLEKHIEDCETCAEDFELYKEMLKSFNLDNIDIVEAPEDFADNVMSQINELNLYFPEKLRSRGQIIDGIIFGIWGLLAFGAVSGISMFIFKDQLFEWLMANNLNAVADILYPFAAFTADFGNTLGSHIINAMSWIADLLRLYGIAVITAILGIIALATLAFKLNFSPQKFKYIKSKK